MEAYVILLWKAVLIRNSVFGILNNYNNKLQWKSEQSLIHGKTVLQFTASLSIVQRGIHDSRHTPELVWQMMAMTSYYLNTHHRILLHSYDNDAARNKITITTLNSFKTSASIWSPILIKSTSNMQPAALL